MILCVNLNAAVDKTLVVENYTLDAIHRTREVLALAGGKGCNVARALKTLGEEAMVTGWVGGFAGRFIESELRGEGIGSAFVHTREESRECVSVVDPARGTLTEVYPYGAPISRAAQVAFRRRFRSLLPSCWLVTLSGSVPAQVPTGIYAELIAEAHEAGVPALFDSSGETLRLGLAARPYLVKPNRAELCGLLGYELTSLPELAEAARALAGRYGTQVVISLGAEGAVASDGAAAWHARPPAVAARSAVGSGDAMLAGLAAGIVRGESLVEALRLGIAAGAANTLCIGAGRLRAEDVVTILPGVTVESLR